MICEEAKCSRLRNGECTVFPAIGVEFRQRYGYCPVPDWPKRTVGADKLRIGQQKGIKVKKKK